MKKKYVVMMLLELVSITEMFAHNHKENCSKYIERVVINRHYKEKQVEKYRKYIKFHYDKIFSGKTFEKINWDTLKIDAYYFILLNGEIINSNRDSIEYKDFIDLSDFDINSYKRIFSCFDCPELPVHEVSVLRIDMGNGTEFLSVLIIDKMSN